MQQRVYICKPCAAKLKDILARDGEEAMARAIAHTLCTDCKAKMPVPDDGRRVVTQLKRPD